MLYAPPSCRSFVATPTPERHLSREAARSALAAGNAAAALRFLPQTAAARSLIGPSNRAGCRSAVAMGISAGAIPRRRRLMPINGPQCRRLAASPIAVKRSPSGARSIFVGALALFRWGLDAARDVYFDETWYVPAARTLMKTGEMLRQEHPPLGKLLIAASMAALRRQSARAGGR